MNPLLIVPHYISWHYTTGISGYFNITKTFTWFLWHFFSIGVLLRTLFFPFQRLNSSSKGSGFDPEAYFSALATNMIMRFVGFFFRSAVIITGLLTILIFIIVGVLGFFVWILLPFLLIAIMILGFRALFTSVKI